jgi:hypothetical protein
MGFALTAEWLLKVMNGFRGANFHIIEGILKAELQCLEFQQITLYNPLCGDLFVGDVPFGCQFLPTATFCIQG